MESNQQDPVPNLQPPGATLPVSQRIVLNLWCGPIASRMTPKAKCRENYERLTERLIQLVSKVPDEKRTVRVLVDPIQGLEDSSRNWSLNLVLEHLLIASRMIERVILTLSSGQGLNGKADTAKVKPKGEDRDFLPEFKDYSPDLMKRIDGKLAQPGMNLDSKLLYSHPWFGECTPRQWYWILSSHQAIHYRQAKKIAQVLGES